MFAGSPWLASSQGRSGEYWPSWISRHSLYRTGGDADRIEMLHPLEHGFDLIQFDFYLLAADCSLNILEGGGQIPGFVDGIDDGEGDGGASTSLNG